MERGQTLAEMALSCILKDDKVTSVLIGASKPEQILDNIKIIGHTDFSDEELKKIDDIGFCQLTSKDVVRHPLVQQIVQAYDDYEKKQKPARRTTRRSEEKKK